MLRMSAFGVIAMAAMMAWVGTARAELVENPQYLSWKQHKPGTTVVLEMTTTSMGQTMTMEMTHTLLEVTDTGATVETSVNIPQMPQQPPPQKQTIPAQVPREQAEMTALPAGTKGTIKPVGNEKIEAGGKSYDCKVHEFTGEQQGQTVSGKLWTTSEVPGMLARMEAKSTGAQGGGDISMKLKSVNSK